MMNLYILSSDLFLYNRYPVLVDHFFLGIIFMPLNIAYSFYLNFSTAIMKTKVNGTLPSKF